MVIELCGVLYKVVLGLDSSGDKVALTPWVNHYFKYFAYVFHCYEYIFLSYPAEPLQPESRILNGIYLLTSDAIHAIASCKETYYGSKQ